MSRYDAEVYIVKHYAGTLFRLSVFDPDIDPGLAELENNPYKKPDSKKNLQREQKSASTQGWTLTLFLAVSGFLLPPLPRMAEVGGVRGALICRRSGFFTSLFCLSHTTIIDPVSLHVLFFSVSNLNCVSISYTVFVVSTLPTLLLCLKIPVSLGKDVSRVEK